MQKLTFPLMAALAALFTSCEKTNEKTNPQPRKVTIEEIEAGIRQHIQSEEKAHGGFFEIADRGLNFRMKLVRVHTEYLANLGPQSHFACVDLVDEKGDVYDVDFFMAGKPGAMTVTEKSVHKLNGKPYYTWKQAADKTWQRAPVKNASNRLLGVIEGSDVFEFFYRVQLPTIEGNGRLWIPIASSDAYQTVEVTGMKVPGNQRILRDDTYGNQVLFTELGPAESGKTVEISYKVQRLEKSAIEAPEQDSAQPLYLAPNLLMPVGGRFEDIAREAIKNRDASDLMKARALYDYVIDNMRYMKYGNYGRGDANYACDIRTGNCSEFHSFFISLARSIGIPARFAVGASIPSERNDGGIDGYHCWAEFYADGKWWPIDISEANKYTALATYYFGHHPANRIELSRGRDLKVSPAPAEGSINFLAFPVFEIDGKKAQAKTTFSFLREG
jgi:transglutaminase-like putative cysteine protease